MDCVSLGFLIAGKLKRWGANCPAFSLGIISWLCTESWSQSRSWQSFWVAEAEIRIWRRWDDWNRQHGVSEMERELCSERAPKNLHKSYIYGYTGKEQLGIEMKTSTTYKSIKTMTYLGVNMSNVYNVFILKTTKHYWNKSKNTLKNKDIPQ